jgi:hypothetical protein
MNIFLAMVVHVASFFALVLVTVACLYAIAIVGRRLLASYEVVAAFQRNVIAMARRLERIEGSLGDKGLECYEAELNAIYVKQPVVDSPDLQSVIGSVQ